MELDMLAELEPVVEQSLNHHLSVARDWMPHDYVPWDQGRDFRSAPWRPADTRLGPAAQTALEVNLLTEDNLPSYHYEIATRFGTDGAWGTWVGRWTAEEGRHAACLRDYLLVTRAVDPDQLEARRMATMEAGYRSGPKSSLESLVYVSLQELATRVSHRNTGRFLADPAGDRLLARIAADENLHMVFYRGLVDASLELDLSRTVCAVARQITNFAMPGTTIPGFQVKAATIARAGIYDLGIHNDEVLRPLLRHWRIMDRGGLDAPAEQARDGLAGFLDRLSGTASRQRERFAATGTRATRTGATVPNGS
jgi:acyl-[acyl-carrier-protein] desaturase